jgi:hypothetical protein
LSNPNLTIEEIAQQHPVFQKYSPSSQRSRLSSLKSILKYGLMEDALQFVIDSKNTKEDTRKKAEYLLKTQTNSTKNKT